MITIAWAVLCEAISRDENNRLSLFGVASDLPVPSLPLVLTEHLIVARLSNSDGNELDVTFGVTTPAGLWVTPIDEEAASVDVSGEYLVITLRSLPLRDEGVHRFEVGLSNGSMASVEIPVWLCAPRDVSPRVH